MHPSKYAQFLQDMLKTYTDLQYHQQINRISQWSHAVVVWTMAMQAGISDYEYAG